MTSKRSLLVLGIVGLVAATSVAGYVSVEAPASQTHGVSSQAPAEMALDQQTPSNNTTRPSEEVIERRALSNNTTVQSVIGNVTITSEIGNGTQTLHANVWQEPPNRVRFEYVSGPAEGTVLVSNGSMIWFYNDTTNTVRRLQYQDGLLGNLTRAFQNISSQYTADYQGQATVSGQETYVVSIRPPNGTLGGILGNQTVWLDQDNYFAVQTQVTTTVGNQTSTTTITYSNLTYNASIPADRFTFEPPENATVVDVNLPQTTTFESLAAATDTVNFTIGTPQSLPDGFQFTNATVIQSGNTTSVSLRYSNETETVVFSQSTANQSTMRRANVSVAGHPASYIAIGNQSVLQWQSNGFSYSVSGPLSRSTLVEIAESIYR